MARHVATNNADAKSWSEETEALMVGHCGKSGYDIMSVGYGTVITGYRTTKVLDGSYSFPLKDNVLTYTFLCK